MRLLLCSMTVPWPERPLQGRYHVRLAQALIAQGHEVRLFSPRPALHRGIATLHPKLRAHAARPERYKLDGIEVASPEVRWAYTTRMRFDLAPHMPELLCETARLAMRTTLDREIEACGAELLLGHGVVPWGALLGEASERHGLRHGFIEHSAEDVLRIEPESRLHRWYRRCTRRAAATVVVGEPMRRHLADELRLPRVEYIPNGADIPIEPCKAPRPTPFAGRTLVLSAGSYYPRKRFELLLRAFAPIAERYPDAILAIATEPSPTMLRLAHETIPEKQLCFLGPLPHARLMAWMGWADLFALPSRSEAFGLVYAEAMARGTPVLMSREGGLAPLLDPVRVNESRLEGEAWVVPTDDLSALIASLDQALDRLDELPRIGARARAWVRRHLDWSASAAALAASLTR